jgi:hypothetical protein
MKSAPRGPEGVRPAGKFRSKTVKHYAMSVTKEVQILLTGIGDGKQQNLVQKDAE